MAVDHHTLKTRARRLRREQTEAESKLWARLPARQLCGAKFRRKHPIGPFITDFCCMERGLVIELDGGQHAVQAKADRRRSVFLEQRGYRVLRFWDHQVLENTEEVLEEIARVLSEPSPVPSPRGRG
jgi:very-short-patch-repair endonuclease